MKRNLLCSWHRNPELWQQMEQHTEVPADHYDMLQSIMILYQFPEIRKLC